MMNASACADEYSCYAGKLRPFASWPFIRRSVEYLNASADRGSASLEHIEAIYWNTQLNGLDYKINQKTVETFPVRKIQALDNHLLRFSLHSTPHAEMPSSQPLHPLLRTIQQTSCYKVPRQGLGHTSELLFTSLLGSLTFKPLSFKCLSSIRLTSCPDLKLVPEGQDTSFGN